MFDLGADIATPFGTDFEEHALRIVARQVTRLEQEIDAMNADLPPLTSFILPGGSAAVASLHLARAIVRRAERAAVALAAEEQVSAAALGLHQPPVGSFVRRGALVGRGGGRRRAVATRRDPDELDRSTRRSGSPRRAR